MYYCSGTEIFMSMSFALKGQGMIAQGNALCHRRANVQALKRRIIAPFQGLRGRYLLPQGVALGSNNIPLRGDKHCVKTSSPEHYLIFVMYAHS